MCNFRYILQLLICLRQVDYFSPTARGPPNSWRFGHRLQQHVKGDPPTCTVDKLKYARNLARTDRWTFFDFLFKTDQQTDRHTESMKLYENVKNKPDEAILVGSQEVFCTLSYFQATQWLTMSYHSIMQTSYPVWIDWVERLYQVDVIS